MQSNFGRWAIAGFLATCVLTTLMTANWIFGVVPQLDLVQIVQTIASLDPATGFVAHVLLGSVIFGPLFALLREWLPGESVIAKGLGYGVVLWIAASPVSGYAMINGQADATTLIATLIYFLIFGAVLGWLWRELVLTSGEQSNPSED